MHGFLRHLHGGDDHAHSETVPQTTGRLIHWAKYYDLVVQIMTLGRAGAIRRLTVDQAQIKPGDRILDVGCGTGALTLLAQERAGSAGQALGIDPSPEMIDVARGKARRKHSAVDFRAGVIEQLPFPDSSFDVVLSSLMMHHLPGDLKPKALAEVRRVIKPGGRLVIIDFKGLLEEQGVAALVKEAGFTQIETCAVWSARLGVIRAE